jgi:hypothetical protein
MLLPVLLSMTGVAAAETCAAPLKAATEVDLYFGRDQAAAGEVSDEAWEAFLAADVTPRFPEGLSVLDVAGQYREPDGRLVREKTKLVVIVVFDASAWRPQVAAIAEAYTRRFGQHGVFRVERAVCAGE